MTDPLPTETCAIPPPGWRCTREPGHEGPCAALPTRRESAMQKTFLRARLINAALAWHRAGCPDSDESGEGPNGELQDVIHEYIDHEQQVAYRAEVRKLGDTP